MKKPPCKWLEHDPEGRPRCEHGWARKRNPGWICRVKADANQRRYRDTPKGQVTERRFRQGEKRRAAQQRYNNSPHGKSQKAIYDLTRIRP